jgi:hypothetical protein
MSNLIIGIDPDLEKSGVATMEVKKLELSCMAFPDLMDYLITFKPNIKKIVIEAGWLNKKSNWHGAKSVELAARIGKNVGENHATGKLIAQMCESMGFVVELVKPTSAKVNADYFKRITDYVGRTNQEVRDAAMLVWGMS